MNTNRLFDVAAAVPAAILNSSQATRLPLQFRGAHPARVAYCGTSPQFSLQKKLLDRHRLTRMKHGC